MDSMLQEISKEDALILCIGQRPPDIQKQNFALLRHNSHIV